MKSTLCVLGVLASIATAVGLQYFEYSYDLVGWTLLAGFVCLVMFSPDGSTKGGSEYVIGTVVDGIDFSFMGKPTKYSDDVHRLMAKFNEPGKVKILTQTRAGWLVREWYKSHGILRYTSLSRPKWFVQTMKAAKVYASKAWAYMNKPLFSKVKQSS
jgi:hypothetical protein